MPANSPSHTNRFLVPGIFILAIAVIGLNVGLFLTVDSHVRSIADKDNQIKRRELDVVAAEGRRDATITEINLLEEQRRKAIADTEDAVKRATDAQARRRERDQLADQITSLNATRGQRENDLAVLRSQIARAQIEESDAKKETKNALEQRQRELRESQGRKEEIDKEISSLSSRKLQLERETEAGRKAAQEAEKLRSQRDDLARGIEDAKRELAGLRNELDQATRQNTNLKAESVQAQESINIRRTDLKNLDDQIKARQADHAEWDKRLRTARQETSAAERAATEARRAQQDLDRITSELEKIRSQLVPLRDEVAKRNADVADLKGQEAALRQAISDLNNELSLSKAFRIEAEQQSSKQRAELSLVSNQLATVRGEIRLLESTRHIFMVTEADIRRVQESKSRAEQELAIARNTLDDLERDIKVARERLKKLSDENRFKARLRKNDEEQSP